MRYLTLTAEYRGLPLRDEALGEVTPEDLDLSSDLAQRIRDWNARYSEVIPLGTEDRRTQRVALLILQLDEEGLGLAQETIAELGEAKVQYYSEGRLRRLP